MTDDEGEPADRDGRASPGGPRDRADGAAADREPGTEGRVQIDASGRGADEDDEFDADENDVRAPEPNSTPIESGSPSLEHALFVLLGAVAMVLTVVRLLQVSLGI